MSDVKIGAKEFGPQSYWLETLAEALEQYVQNTDPDGLTSREKAKLEAAEAMLDQTAVVMAGWAG